MAKHTEYTLFNTFALELLSGFSFPFNRHKNQPDEASVLL